MVEIVEFAEKAEGGKVYRVQYKDKKSGKLKKELIRDYNTNSIKATLEQMGKKYIRSHRMKSYD
jgi:hypothetical protein